MGEVRNFIVFEASIRPSSELPSCPTLSSHLEGFIWVPLEGKDDSLRVADLLRRATLLPPWSHWARIERI